MSSALQCQLLGQQTLTKQSWIKGILWLWVGN